MFKKKTDQGFSQARTNDCPDDRSKSRRGFFKGILAAATMPLALGRTALGQSTGNPATLEQLVRANGRPIVLKNGIVLSMDSTVGDFEKADVLIQGKRIKAIGPNLGVPEAGIVTDAAGMIVMPGFVDTHHHQYETPLRSILSDGLWGMHNDPLPQNNYATVIQKTFTPAYLPEDARIAELVASLNQINAGVTTTVDVSQVSLSPEHSDACIAGLRESGRRAVFAYSAGVGPKSRFPQDIVRLKKQYFSSDDQLLTLALNPGMMMQHWPLARSLGVPLVSHLMAGNFDRTELLKPGMMGPDNEFIHCTRIDETLWKAIADAGVKVSIAPAIEMQMKHGMPPIQTALDHGIRPSLSVDVECNMTADLFTVMRTAFTLQRALVNQRSIAGERDVPRLLTCRDVIELATIEGARVAHLDHKIGSLSPGKEADIIMLATSRINIFPLNNVPGAIVTLMDTSNVENVFVAGNVMKWQGKLIGTDLTILQRQIEASREGLLTRTNYPRDLFATCCPGPWASNSS